MQPYFSAGGITIYHGDCADIIDHLELAAPIMAVVTDPPYGINENSRKQQSRGRGGFLQKSKRKAKAKVTDYGHFDWDKSAPSDDLFLKLREISKYQIIFGGNYFNLPPTSCMLVWDKDNGANDFADCELAWTNLKKAVRLFKYRWNGMLQADMANKEVRLHPTQKPIAVMRWCLEQLPEKGLILDPFAGSGSTLLAAQLMGLPAIGIEKDERYCEIAAKTLNGDMPRFEQEKQHIYGRQAGQMDLFKEGLI